MGPGTVQDPCSWHTEECAVFSVLGLMLASDVNSSQFAELKFSDCC